MQFGLFGSAQATPTVSARELARAFTTTSTTMWKLKRLAQLVRAQVKLSDDACFRRGVINHVEIRTSHLCQLKALSDGAAFAVLPFVGSWPLAAAPAGDGRGVKLRDSK
jgi:hypothetical protein